MRAAGIAAVLATAFCLCSASALSAGSISLDVHDAPLADVLALLGAEAGENVVADSSVKPERVTLHLHDVTFAQALAVLVRSHALQVRRDGGVLIVGASDAMNRRFDASGEALGSQTVVLRLMHASPSDVAKEVADALPPGTVIVPDLRTASIVISADASTVLRARDLVQALDAAGNDGRGGSGAVVYRLQFLRATDAVTMLKGVVSAGSVVADDAMNAVLVSGDDADRTAARSFLAAADIASPQVSFEVRVADVEPINETSDFGVEFGGVDLQGQPLLGAATYSFSKGTAVINARLNALVTEGRAQILATPRLVTMNNHEADLLIGQTYPIVYQTSAFGGQQVQFVDIGVKLRLTPTIGPYGSVTAEIHPEYSEIEGFTSTNLPIIANRKIDSTLRVQSDQTIVLGGLLRDVSTETVTKIPGLSSIPILGKFFEDKATHHERNEIVFLITPHVIYPGTPLPTK